MPGSTLPFLPLSFLTAICYLNFISRIILGGSTPQGGPLKGTGIGLSVVREFVEAHGGTVEIVTGQYPGAHLRIRLPAALRPEAAHAA